MRNKYEMNQPYKYEMNQNQPHKTGMAFFGPSKWNSIHSTCAAYDYENCSKFKEWIRLEFELLPCKTCKTHALEMLKVIPRILIF